MAPACLGIALVAGGGYALWPPAGSQLMGGQRQRASPRVPPVSPPPVQPAIKAKRRRHPHASSCAGTVAGAPLQPPVDMAAMMRVLSDVPCARLRAVDREGAVAIQGYSGDAESFTRALASLSAQWRVPIRADQVGSLDRQYCDPLELCSRSSGEQRWPTPPHARRAQRGDATP
ncbi:MAG: hypothetical protein IPK78_19585 [Rhodospirillales bacterium]|nr:hypothetical protein [Rhodospirillales bacterium]